MSSRARNVGGVCLINRELLRWPGVPAMFRFTDPDGNGFEIVE